MMQLTPPISTGIPRQHESTIAIINIEVYENLSLNLGMNIQIALREKAKNERR